MRVTAMKNNDEEQYEIPFTGSNTNGNMVANTNQSCEFSLGDKIEFKNKLKDIQELTKEIENLQLELRTTLIDVKEKFGISSSMMRKFSSMQRKAKSLDKKREEFASLCKLADIKTQMSFDDFGLL